METHTVPNQSMRSSQNAERSRRSAVGISFLLGLAALHFSWLSFRWGPEDLHLVLGNALYILPTLAAALVALIAASEKQGKQRRGWLLIGLGLVALGVGSSIWAYLELVLGVEPFPSVGDLFYLMFGPLLAVGLFWLMPPPRSRFEGARLAMDLAITVGAVGLYFWRFLLAPPLDWGMGLWSTSVTLAYPLLDLLLLSLLLLMVMYEWRDEPPHLELSLMGLGIAAQVAADLLFNAFTSAGAYYSGHSMDALWTASATLIALAAWAGRGRLGRFTKRYVVTFRGHAVIAMPYLAVASGLGLLLVTQTNPAVRDSLGGRGVLYGATVVTLLVVLRQFVAFNENRRLAQRLVRQSETLEQRVRERTAELEALGLRFRHDALHDALTGLPNRPHFRKRLHDVTMHARPFAVLYIDFDRFKAVNDSFGHATGDALLVAVGAQLKAHMRPGVLLARLGGDEFAVLLEELSEPEDAVRIADRLIKLFQEPIQAGGHTLYCQASIGVVLGDKNRASEDSVLRDADTAMYRAKAEGRSQYAVFEPHMREAIQTRLTLETDLRRAVARGELTVHYQPIMYGASGKVAGLEALVRWRHPERGLVPPAAFIPLAEESGLIIEIDRWVLKTACAQLKAWSASNPRLALSVNLSSRQFVRPDLAPFVAGVLAELHLEPGRLKIELTEGVSLDVSLAVKESLAALRQLGVRLHIDDFGTGYSSLSYLQRFRADALKVDRSFVMRMLENEESAELVRTIVSMAHNLGMQVVAEGVETVEQYNRLRGMGCEYVQGYFFSEPMPETAAELFLSNKKITQAA